MENKTKEQILKEISGGVYGVYTEKTCHIGMETYAQQQSKIKAVEFAEWIDLNDWLHFRNDGIPNGWCQYKKHYGLHDCLKHLITTTQLYELFELNNKDK